MTEYSLYKVTTFRGKPAPKSTILIFSAVETANLKKKYNF